MVKKKKRVRIPAFGIVPALRLQVFVLNSPHRENGDLLLNNMDYSLNSNSLAIGISRTSAISNRSSRETEVGIFGASILLK